MILRKLCFICLALFFGLQLCYGQRIVYSEPDREDAKSINFDIVGKLDNNIVVYKNYRGNHSVTLYDDNMKQVAKEPLNFMPDKVINSEVLPYKDFFYLFYQYQRRNLVYCMAAKIDASGKIMGKPYELDTTHIGFMTSNKIYSFIYSEDKKKIMAFKINSKNDKNYVVTTSLFDLDLNLISKNQIGISMPDRGDFLTEFNLDNDGDLVFLRAAAGTSQNTNINKLTFITKKANDDTVNTYDLDVSKNYLDDVRLKVDNQNKHYLITSFSTKNRRGNIDGLYTTVWDKNSASILFTENTVFDDQLRADAKSEGNAKLAFNNYFLQNIVMRKDGGYLIAAESVYSSSRGNTLSRWDYLYGSPYWSPSDYYMYRSPFGYYYPWWRSNGFGNANTRYYADNVVLLSFDSTGKMEWANVIRKSQYDDNTDNFIGYTTLNTGSEVHFIFNQLEKRTMLLSDQSITSDGQIHRSPTFRGLDKGYQFMPRFAKQVGSRQLIIPCQYRNYICFAQIDL